MSITEPYIAVVAGTRPELVKLSPVVNELVRRSTQYFFVHSGQHYSENMDAIFQNELGIPAPKYSLRVGSGSHGKQTAKMLEVMEEIFMNERPTVVVVQGDTNTVLAGALAAIKLGIPVSHIEAGLRSGDRSMPEEQNRILVDHVSTFLHAPTDTAVEHLAAEGIVGEHVQMTYNTIVDAVHEQKERALQMSTIHATLDAPHRKYILATLHRAENTDVRERLELLGRSLIESSAALQLPVVLPLHPRTRSRLSSYGLDDLFTGSGVRIVEPLGYLDFLALEAEAALIMTDSGGIQEEACILRVPCVTLRTSTERPETIAAGANVLGGLTTDEIVENAVQMIASSRNWADVYGTGGASKKIVDAVTQV